MPSDLTPQDQLLQELEQARQRIAEMESAQEELKQTQAALKESTQRYRNLFENAGDSIFIIDPTNFRILEANANAARRLKYAHKELCQLSLSDIQVLNKEDSPGESLEWQSTVSGTRVYECHYRRKDGVLVPVEVSSRLVTVGKRLLLQNFVRDNTKRKQAEAEREALIAELDAFAHTVAHDLKNPLSVLTGYGYVLSLDLADSPNEETRKGVQAIVRTSAKMNTIINELLLLAGVRRMDEIALEPLDMATIVNGALERLATLVAENQAEIILPDAWPQALGYGAWVEEVWANYTSNAIKYGGRPDEGVPPRVELGWDWVKDESRRMRAEGGNSSPSTPLRTSFIPHPSSFLRFWVRDNGLGLAQEEQDQLFAEFTRLHQVRAKGHGLGLSIVQRIVNKLGGQVGVESTLGQGSLFYFTLPASGDVSGR